MEKSISFQDRVAGALFGMFIGDALAMPVHWYYNTKALRKDYGEVNRYLKPHNPHPDSILWRSSYSASNTSADILHGQKQFWGPKGKGIHYHQFLEAGENTLNVKLARELLITMEQDGAYVAETWLERMISYLTTPGNHQDTYVEEYLRHFFTNYGRGKKPLECGRKDENHIGGFSLMLPLLIVFGQSPVDAKPLALEHLTLTHGGAAMEKWGACIASVLLRLLHGYSLQESIQTASNESPIELDYDQLWPLQDYPDDFVVGKHFSSACYVDQSVPATIYLALKYRNDPQKALVANTMCGGDNAGRGVVLGAMLGALHGIDGWPSSWVEGLLHPPPIVHLDSL